MLHTGFLYRQRAGAILCYSAWASSCGVVASAVVAHRFKSTGLSSCAWPVALWHVEASWNRNRTHVSCIGRSILNHCTTRESSCCFYNSPQLLHYEGQKYKFSLLCSVLLPESLSCWQQSPHTAVCCTKRGVPAARFTSPVLSSSDQGDSAPRAVAWG